MAKPKQLWIGVAEVRPIHKENEIMRGKKGAFVNIVTWACSPEDYSTNIEQLARKLGLFVSEIINPESVDARREKVGRFKEEIEDVISRAQDNPDATIYGTFHTFQKDDA